MNLPVSIKAVLRDERNRILLLKNERQEWELPGGRLDPGEQPLECLLREIHEEVSLGACVEGILDSHVFEVLPGRRVFIVVYACRVLTMDDPVLSDEHREWAWFTPDSLPGGLPAGYRQAIARLQG